MTSKKKLHILFVFAALSAAIYDSYGFKGHLGAVQTSSNLLQVSDDGEAAAVLGGQTSSNPRKRKGE